VESMFLFFIFPGRPRSPTSTPTHTSSLDQSISANQPHRQSLLAPTQLVPDPRNRFDERGMSSKTTPLRPPGLQKSNDLSGWNLTAFPRNSKTVGLKILEPSSQGGVFQWRPIVSSLFKSSCRPASKLDRFSIAGHPKGRSAPDHA